MKHSKISEKNIEFCIKIFFVNNEYIVNPIADKVHSILNVILLFFLINGLFSVSAGANINIKIIDNIDTINLI